MRIGIRKLLLLGGSAAILSTAGFAYMASNTLPVTSAGEGSAAVTGYTATDVSYNGDSGRGCGAVLGCYIGQIEFRLTANDYHSQNNGMPDFVYAAIFNSSGHNIANADGCSPIPVTDGSPGAPWTAVLHCNLVATDSPPQNTVANVATYDIAATQ
jgi:hypothetical protein